MQGSVEEAASKVRGLLDKYAGQENHKSAILGSLECLAQEPNLHVLETVPDLERSIVLYIKSLREGEFRYSPFVADVSRLPLTAATAAKLLDEFPGVKPGSWPAPEEVAAYTVRDWLYIGMLTVQAKPELSAEQAQELEEFALRCGCSF